MRDDVPQSGSDTSAPQSGSDASESTSRDSSTSLTEDRRTPPTRDYADPTGRSPRESTPGRKSDDGSSWKLYAYDLLSSVVIVILIGALLFTASGIWPPMVAVESGSMEPVMEKGDLVFVMEADRFPGPGAHESGVVPAKVGAETGYDKFDGTGDVIVYQPNGDDSRTPVIHRAMFWVEEGENWVEKANPEYLGSGSSCEGVDSVPNCPAPHAGFITKGDANGQYDQVNNIARKGPVKPAWIIGTAEYSVPYLGSIRLNAEAGARTNTTGTASVDVARAIPTDGTAMTNDAGTTNETESVVETSLDERLDVLDVAESGVAQQDGFGLVDRD